MSFDEYLHSVFCKWGATMEASAINQVKNDPQLLTIWQKNYKINQDQKPIRYLNKVETQ